MTGHCFLQVILTGKKEVNDLNIYKNLAAEMARGGDGDEKVISGNDHGVCSRVVFQLDVYKNPAVFHA